MLSTDDSKLYFVSDRLPSKGSTDIFVVDILKEGDYSKPRNLGSFVNTSGNETTPFITDDNILYFSSDGHEGQGKLDVFAVEIYENETSEVYRLSSPINSINDDFAYIVNQDNNQGFFTSNRLQGEGFNDLYSFTLEEDVRPGECFITVDGKVRDKDSYEAIGGATVDLYSIDGSLLESVDTYSDGTYQFTVSCAKEYELIASNPDYKDDKKRIEILEENYHSALHTNMNLSKIEKKPAFNKFSPIYYEFDDAEITREAAEEMDRNAEVMKGNENLIIEASSFTDSRGTDAYNVELSKRRAKAAVEYLKSQGIDESRIRSKGYGESKLINQCVNGVECKEESHQLNRRTEFNFVNIPASAKKKKSSSSRSEVAVQPKKTVTPVSVTPQKIGKLKTEEQVAISEVKSKPEVQVLEKANEKPAMKEAKTIDNSQVETVKVAAIGQQINAPEVDQNTLKVTPKEPIFKSIVLDEAKVVESNKVETLKVTSIGQQINVPTADQNQLKVTQVKTAYHKPEPEMAVAEEKIEERKSSPIKEVAAVSIPESEKKTSDKQVKEAVVINYNSSIVATNPESNKVLNYIGTEKSK